MDVDTSHALDRLGDRIDHLEVAWRELRGEVGELRGEVGELRGGMSALRDGLQALSHRVDEGRRHADVLYESLRDDIRLVAEGLAVIGAKLDDRRS